METKPDWYLQPYDPSLPASPSNTNGWHAKGESWNHPRVVAYLPPIKLPLPKRRVRTLRDLPLKCAS